MAVKLALFKGKGLIGNALIRFWTRSPYSHCELVVNGVAMSSSLMDGGVRAKSINLLSPDWVSFDLPWADEKQVLAHFEWTNGQTYSMLDLFRSQVLNLASDEQTASFCSEWCAAALRLPNPVTFSPETLGDMCAWLNTFNP